MDIRIGVTDNPREINVQLAADVDRKSVKAQIESAIAGDTSTLWLTDEKGRDVAVAADKIVYVEVGPEGDTHPIGFG